MAQISPKFPRQRNVFYGLFDEAREQAAVEANRRREASLKQAGTGIEVHQLV